MAKLNRDEILVGLLKTLVDGYGRPAIDRALQRLDGKGEARQERAAQSEPEIQKGAERIVSEANIAPEKKPLIIEIARRFDEGSAFPKASDVRSFLISHHQTVGELKSRPASFRQMLPVLIAMSPKGLEKVLSRSQFSGPADLGAISDAIRGAGEEWRGRPATDD